MQTTIREHRDGGAAGGVFKSYSIVKVCISLNLNSNNLFELNAAVVSPASFLFSCTKLIVWYITRCCYRFVSFGVSQLLFDFVLLYYTNRLWRH